MQCRSPPGGPPSRCLDPAISVSPSAARHWPSLSPPTGGVAPVLQAPSGAPCPRAPDSSQAKGRTPTALLPVLDNVGSALLSSLLSLPFSSSRARDQSQARHKGKLKRPFVGECTVPARYPPDAWLRLVHKCESPWRPQMAGGGGLATTTTGWSAFLLSLCPLCCTAQPQAQQRSQPQPLSSLQLQPQPQPSLQSLLQPQSQSRPALLATGPCKLDPGLCETCHSAYAP